MRPIPTKPARTTHIFCHRVYVRTGPVVHHGIREHQVNVPLKFQRVGYRPVLDSRFNGLEVHWPLHDFMVVGSFGVLDGIVKDGAVAVLGDLGMKKSYDILETLVGQLFVCLTVPFAARGTRRGRP